MLIIPNMTYTTHHPPNFLLPHVWCIIFHDFSSPSLCWSSHAWLPPTTCHPPTQPPPTQLFVSPCMIHNFSQFFKPFIMLIIPCMISTTHPPTTTNPTFCYPIYDTLFLKIFQAQHYADHPVHDFDHPTATHPIFCFPMYDTSFFTIFQDHHLLIIPCMHNFGPIDLKFWEQICNTICHNLRGDNYLKLAADCTILVQLTQNFRS